MGAVSPSVRFCGQNASPVVVQQEGKPLLLLGRIKAEILFNREQQTEQSNQLLQIFLSGLAHQGHGDLPFYSMR